MSLFNGIVEAPFSEFFETWPEVQMFITAITEGIGQHSFEGLIVRENGYTIHYFC